MIIRTKKRFHKQYMENINMKRCSISVVIRKMQVKTTTKYLHTSPESLDEKVTFARVSE